MSNLLSLLKSHGFDPQRVGSKHGGEYHCKCPQCGGRKHRLRVWPEQPNERHGVPGSYSCRICDFKGDIVQWFVDLEGMSYPEAFRAAGIESGPGGGRKARSPRPGRKQARPEWKPREYAQPPLAWRREAAKLVREAHELLLRSPDRLDYLARRGVTREGVVRYRLGYLPGKGRFKCHFKSRQAWGLPKELRKGGRPKPLWIPRGIVIPLFNEQGHVIRVRIRRHNEDLTEEFDNKYHALPKSCMAPLVSRTDAKAYVVQETDFDAIAVDLCAGDLVGSVALGTLSIKPDVNLWPVLRDAGCVLNGLDFDRVDTSDEEQRRIAALHAEAKAWWQRELPQCKRHPVPQGKDGGDFVERYGGNLRTWVLSGLPPVFHRKQQATASEPPKALPEPTPKSPPRAAGLAASLPKPLEDLRYLLATNRLEIQVGEAGSILGCRGPVEASTKATVLCQEPLVRKWLQEIGEGRVTIRNYLNPMEVNR